MGETVYEINAGSDLFVCNSFYKKHYIKSYTVLWGISGSFHMCDI